MSEVSEGERWVLDLVAEMAAELGISEARGRWGPPVEGFTTGKRNLTITVGIRQRREVFLAKDLEDVVATPGIQQAIRNQLRSALPALR